MPCTTHMEPRVAIRGGMRRPATLNPVRKPTRPQRARAASRLAIRFRPSGTAPYRPFITQATMTEDMLAMLPTDRSMPPVITTRDSPSTRKPKIAVSSRMARMLNSLTKVGLMMVPRRMIPAATGSML